MGGLFTIVNKPVAEVAPFEMNVHKPKDDMAVSADILRKGCFECEIVRPAMAALQNRPGAALLDIGTNIGLYTLRAAAMGRQTYSFEPFRENWKRVCNSINLNPGFEKRVTLFKVAAVDKPMIIEFDTRMT